MDMMDRVRDYLRDNLRDPGTMRSLIWALLSLALMPRAETAMEHYAVLGMFVLGVVSAAIPPRKP
jgi:hypothetical protein